MNFNDEFFEEDEYTLKGRGILLSGDKTDSIDDLNCVNAYVSELLLITFNIAFYTLTQSDKDILISYFENFYKKSLENYSKLNSNNINKILDYMVKILCYEKNDDSIFIISLYFENLVNDLRVLSQKEYVNEEFVLTLLFSCSIDEFDLVQQYLRKSEDAYKSKVIEKYIEEFIDHTIFEDRKTREKEEEGFKILKKYIDEITKRKDFDIFNEQYVSDILQLIYTHRLEDERAKEIQDILKKNLHVSRIDARAELNKLTDFINAPQNQVITDEDKMDEFAKHLGNLKLVNYRIINQNLIDFVLKQVFLKDSAISKNPEKYRGLIERCIEDLGRNDLPAKVDQCDYVYFIRDCISRNLTTVGLNRSKLGIYLKRDIVNDFLNHKSYVALETIFHENAHASQTYDIESAEYNDYYRYLMTKEKIIEEYDPKFYSINYEYMFIEIDARILESRKMLQFLKRVKPIDIMGMIVDDLKNVILSYYNEKMSKEYVYLSMGKYKRISYEFNDVYKVEDLFDEVILAWPWCLEEYPKLKIEYNENGIIKRIGQILADIDSKFYMSIQEDVFRDKDVDKHNASIGRFYLKILRNGNCLKPENLPEDLRTIMNYEIKNKETIYIMALIISQNIPRLLNRLSEIPNEKKRELYYEIDVVSNRIEEIRKKPEEELTYSEIALLKGFTKTDRQFLTSTLSMLHFIKERIEFLGIDLTPVSVRNLDNLNPTETTSPADINGQNGASILAKSFYATTEEDRTKLMTELINLGYRIQLPTESKSSDIGKEDKTFR